MIDPLRPYWPTNRSLAGLLLRMSCLSLAAGAVIFAFARPVVIAVVLFSAFAQAALLAFEWMEFRRAQRRGLLLVGVIGVIFGSLLIALFLEARSMLVLSPR